MATLQSSYAWFKEQQAPRAPDHHLVQLALQQHDQKGKPKQVPLRSSSQQALMEDDVVDSTPPLSLSKTTGTQSNKSIGGNQGPSKKAKSRHASEGSGASVQDIRKSVTKAMHRQEPAPSTTKVSHAAPGGSRGKATFKYILRDRCPAAFSSSIPDNVLFGAEDATYTIKSTGERIMTKDRDGNATFVIKKARTLYFNIISTADYMLTNTSTMVYHLAFDIPQLVPRNKAETQSARRTGKDEKLDANGVPQVSWDGNGIYLYPDTPLYEWQRIHADSGGNAFRQILCDVFIMLMAFYRPPDGKTLLVSGMLSHPGKKDPAKRTTCRKVYVLHTPVGCKETGSRGETGEFGNSGPAFMDSDEDLEGTVVPPWSPEGYIPYLSDVTPDAIDSDGTGRSAEEIIKSWRATYSSRLHAHVREYRKCVPGLRMTAGEGEVAIFHMLQIIAGKAATAHGGTKGDDAAVPRKWLLGKMGREDLLGATWESALDHDQHESLPGVVLRSADTDIIHLGLAAASHLDESRGEGATGWHSVGPADIGEIRWQGPSFSWAVYLDMYTKQVDEQEYVALVRKALLKNIIDHRTDEGVLRGHVSTNQQPHVTHAVISDEDEFLIREMVKAKMDGTNGKKVRLDDFIQVNTLYSLTLERINLPSPVPLEIRKDCKGYVPCPIHVIIAAAKLHGSDDYVVPCINNIPMGWYTEAVYSFGSECNPLKILVLPPEQAAHPHARSPRETIRRSLATVVSPTGYLNLTKGAVIECYHLKKCDIRKQDPSKVTLGSLSRCIKRYSPSSWLPKAPFYAPKAMRMLWSIQYTFLAQLSPEAVPDATLLGWSNGENGHLIAHIEPGSYHEETTKKKEDAKRKREDAKMRKDVSSNSILL